MTLGEAQQLLKVDLPISQAALRNAYRRAARAPHPDRHRVDPSVAPRSRVTLTGR